MIVMIYLNLADNGRVLSAQFMPKTETAVDKLPDGNITDYRYADGKFILDPLPEPEPKEPAPTADELAMGIAEIAEMVANNASSIDDINNAIVELGDIIGG